MFGTNIDTQGSVSLHYRQELRIIITQRAKYAKTFHAACMCVGTDGIWSSDCTSHVTLLPP